MSFKKEVYNGLSLELNTPFDFQLKIKLVPFSILILKHQKLVDKQMHFEIHHYLLNKSYLRKNHNSSSLEYLVSLELLNVLFYLKKFAS